MGAIAVIAAGLGVVAGNGFAPRVDDYGIRSPLPGPHLASIGNADGVVAVLALGGLIGCLAAVVVKFRRSGPTGRRQIGWYGYGYAITAVVLVVAVTTNVPSALLAIGPLSVATGAAIAILNLRLYDIDRIVNRTLAWGLLTALVVALYVVCVGFFERAFAGRGSLGGLLATAVVAVAFQPLRSSVQRAVNQLIYGNRDQPEVIFRELAMMLDRDAGAEDPFAALAESLARSLRLPAVVLEVDGGSDLRTSYASDPARTTGLLQAASAQTGGTRVQVWVSPRGPGPLSARDRQLLDSLAPSLVAAAEAVRLRRALETARVRAIRTLAEEQRRMRRDLHDGLGPVLAGVRLTIGAARRVIATDPDDADRMLADAQADALSAMDDVRRLAHDLRPPSLDELGLASALRDRLDRLVDGTCQLQFDASELVDPLPAAVEVAAYRIGSEAVLNAVRHAAATTCAVTLRGGKGGLSLTIVDDGAGLPSAITAHVGLRSMRERAEELGGTIAFTATAGEGTAVNVWLPCLDGSIV
jgi:signal transduction histidine kinase